MQAKGIEPSVKDFHIILNAAAASKDQSVIKSLMEKMKAGFGTITNIDCIQLLKGSTPKEVLSLMASRNVKPDATLLLALSARLRDNPDIHSVRCLEQFLGTENPEPLVHLYHKTGSDADVYRLVTQRQGWAPQHNSTRVTVLKVFMALLKEATTSGKFDTAINLLQEMRRSIIKPDGIVWKQVIAPLAKQSQIQPILRLVEQMHADGISTDAMVWTMILSTCNRVGDAQDLDKAAHLYETASIIPDLILQTTLVETHCKRGDLIAAHSILEEIERNDHHKPIANSTWNILITTLAKSNQLDRALSIFNNHPIHRQPSIQTWMILISAAKNIPSIHCVQLIRERVRSLPHWNNISLRNNLLDAYVKCRRFDLAEAEFNELKTQLHADVVSWNIMIAGYGGSGKPAMALDVFHDLQASNVEATPATYASILPHLTEIDEILAIHKSVKTWRNEHTSVTTAIMDAYIRCGRIDLAQDIFDKMVSSRTCDVTAFNVMMSALGKMHRFNEALQLVQEMKHLGLKPDQATYVSLLMGCKSARSLEQTQHIHRLLADSSLDNIIVNNCLLDAYIECGRLDLAQSHFSKMLHVPNGVDSITYNLMIGGHAKANQFHQSHQLLKTATVSLDPQPWNTLMFAYARNDRYVDALNLMEEMERCGPSPDALSWSALVLACTSTSSIETGKQLYQRIQASPFGTNGTVLSYLISMFAKCGSLDMASEIWDSIPASDRTDELVTSMMFAWGSRGRAQDVLRLFRQQESPSDDMITAVLNACSHAGFVDEALQLYQSAVEADRAWNTMSHNAFIDALCRAKKLDMAEDHTRNFVPNRITWMTILSGCKFAGDVERAPRIAEKAFQFDENAAPYVLLSNIFASVKDHSKVTEIRKEMKEKRIKKTPGRVKVEVDGKITEFVVNDQTHPQGPQIRALLHDLFHELYADGFKHDHDAVLREFESADEERVHLCEHSEKLAIGFALLNTKEGTPIKLVKNLRVCSDCHEATKAISKLTNRVINVRDANRWHHFKDGQCDCGDYF
eukprot:TRINITY_DN3068_c0_g1_i1.p1 TRINITY_DN3068_c0_g1~~TRINITY_DN3068_c0_g1_i1.p1  ORF type:complete len:1026 (-),score=156.12 TRINITY_DN3068_c0_g1_i1:50-3127(-)